jgi:cation diffusion facilitator family transporter
MVPRQSREHHEKWWAAATSVVAAVFLTIFKVAVGVTTGSLGILAEAAHSLLDLAAALVTFAAINISARPADAGHHYGHGKFENLSAFIEVMLLLATCAWIFYEAAQRLFVYTAVVHANLWAFLVMLVSIAINYPRARQLERVGRQYNSQALEADALHFRTDIWSSMVVLVGLALVVVGHILGREELFTRADALAAIGVAVVMIYATLRLGRRTLDALLDAAPRGVAEAIRRRVAGVPGVYRVDQVRVRQAGPESFVDVTVSIQRSSLFEEAHEIATTVENAVREILPRADVIVHTNPVATNTESILRAIRFIAARLSLAVHHLTIQEVHGRYYVALDLEVGEDLTLGQAHELASLLERTIRQELPAVVKVDTHIEPRLLDVATGRDVTAQSTGMVETVRKTAEGIPMVRDCHNITILQSDGRLTISMHCRLDPSSSMREVHAASEAVISAIRQVIPEAERILVHTEP